MTGINVERPELIKMMVDAVAEEHGEKAVDKVDLEQLANSCLADMRKSIEVMIGVAKNQAEGCNRKARSKIIKVGGYLLS